MKLDPLNFNLSPDVVSAKLATAVEEMVDQHNLAINGLTRDQTVEAFRQAIMCGDFVRFVVVSDGRQAVIYIPFQEQSRLRGRIERLEKALKDAGVTDPDTIVPEDE